jgi:hypothetical protein
VSRECEPRPDRAVAPEPPCIVVLDGGCAPAVLREVCAGAEEEGVPVRVDSPDGPAPAGSPDGSAPSGETDAPSGETEAPVLSGETDAPALSDGPAADGSSGAARLARVAALRSRLEVGVGLDRSGAVVVQHATLPETAPALRVPAGPGSSGPDWRRAGRVAARIVTRLPLS